jgi:hypothetical protein
MPKKKYKKILCVICLEYKKQNSIITCKYVNDHNQCKSCQKQMKRQDFKSNIKPRRCFCEKPISRNQNHNAFLSDEVKTVMKNNPTKYRQCPKCFVPIEHNGGCNYMKCSKCGRDFCWTCGWSMSIGEKSHINCWDHWDNYNYCWNINTPFIPYWKFKLCLLKIILMIFACLLYVLCVLHK